MISVQMSPANLNFDESSIDVPLQRLREYPWKEEAILAGYIYLVRIFFLFVYVLFVSYWMYRVPSWKNIRNSNVAWVKGYINILHT